MNNHEDVNDSINPLENNTEIETSSAAPRQPPIIIKGSSASTETDSDGETDGAKDN